MTGFSPSPLPCDSGTQPEIADSFHACLPTCNVFIKVKAYRAQTGLRPAISTSVLVTSASTEMVRWWLWYHQECSEKVSGPRVTQCCYCCTQTVALMGNCSGGSSILVSRHLLLAATVAAAAPKPPATTNTTSYALRWRPTTTALMGACLHSVQIMPDLRPTETKYDEFALIVRK